LALFGKAELAHDRCDLHLIGAALALYWLADCFG
jgi:hypothetical protein